MSISDQITEIEVSIEFLEKQIQRKEDLEELYKNKFFKEVILEGYFKELASNTVMLKARKEHSAEHQQKDLDNQLMGIASLNEYFNSIKALAVQAEKTIAADAITREELLAEDMNDE